MMPIRETLKEAGYINIESIGNGEFILTDESGKKELWFANKNHASYGIIYKNTHLEFVRTYIDPIDLENEQADNEWNEQNIFDH